MNKNNEQSDMSDLAYAEGEKMRHRLKSEKRTVSSDQIPFKASPSSTLKRFSVDSITLDCKRIVHAWSKSSHYRVTASTPKKKLSEPASSHYVNRRVRMMTNNSIINTSFDDSVFYSGNYEEVLETTRGLCRDYICYRLKRSGFRGRVVITKYLPAQDQNLSFDILKVGHTFEMLYPHLFRNLARQLGYVLKSEHELRVLFDRLASNIVGHDPEEITWARILALLGIAGALSVDCMAQGHCELIEDMVTIFCDFVEKNLLTWIMDRGGWMGMAKTFGDSENQVEQRTDFIAKRFNKMCGPFALASILVISGIAFWSVLSTYDISYVLKDLLKQL